MSKKKRFGISEALNRGLSETINVVENNPSLYRQVVLPLSRIELDPENPRKLAIDLADIRSGLQPNDPFLQRKQIELARLQELAQTIQATGIINPVVVYKLGEVYRIVAGERRCLASILAGKQEIDARVFNEKPRSFELKLVQWIENTAREDLTLDERLGNIREIIREYKKLHDNVEVSATLLKSITGLSLSQTTYYLAAIHAPEDVQAHIQSGSIRNLDKAALLAGISSPDIRHQAIQVCINGANLKEIRHVINQQKALQKSNVFLQTEKRGRATAKINMGSTLKAGVIKTIVDCVLSQKGLNQHEEYFSLVDWTDMRQATKAFRKLIEMMEVEMVA